MCCWVGNLQDSTPSQDAIGIYQLPGKKMRVSSAVEPQVGFPCYSGQCYTHVHEGKAK